MRDKIVDETAHRNRHALFEDRTDAGKYLASMLSQSEDNDAQTIILAIPSGGVPIGLELKRKLDLPMDLLITRKMQIPGNTEAGFGAMTMDGRVFFNQELLTRLDLSRELIEQEKEKVRQELDRRNANLRGGRPLPPIDGKKAILADDGLASGYTMMAAIDMVKRQQASAIIIAVPTAPLSSIHRIVDSVDKIYCPNIQDRGSFAVAAAYRKWYDLEPEETLRLVRSIGSPMG